MTDKKKSGVSFLWGMLTGTIVGGVSALLFAPKKGSELRADIKEGTVKAVEASSQALQTAKEKVVEVSKAVETKTVELVQDAKQTIQKFTKKEEQEEASRIEVAALNESELEAINESEPN